MLGASWKFVDDFLVLFDNAVRKFIENIWKALETGWRQFWDGVAGLFSPAAIGSGFAQVGSQVGKSVLDSVNKIIPELIIQFSRIGKTILDGLWDGISESWERFKDIGKAIWDGFKQVFNLNIGGGEALSWQTLGNRLGFANGGVVPQYFAAGGRPRGTDTIPAWLTPGEFVINRNGASKNPGLVSAINNSGSGIGLEQKLDKLLTLLSSQDNQGDIVVKVDSHEIARAVRKSSEYGFKGIK
jgi:hypothetical protein